MALSAKLELKQRQALVITPQLQQAIKLLQLSNLELAAFIERELERNPLLERDEFPDESPNLTAPGAGPAASSYEQTGNGKLAAQPAENWPGSASADAAADRQAAPGAGEAAQARLNGAGEGPQDSGWASLPAAAHGFSGETGFEAHIPEVTSLHSHLKQQLQLALTDPARRLIGDYLIDMVDEAGYLQGDLAEAAAQLGAPLSWIEETLSVLQTFDPPGVCARGLKECLTLQLKEQNRFDPVIAKLLDHLDLLASGDLARLRRLCGADEENLVEMIAEIRALHPKPGLRFGRVSIQPVIPDVVVRPRAGGGWHIEINSETLPRLLVNRSYYAVVSKAAKSAKEKDYITECFSNANWLIKSLDQRTRTIVKVAEEIVKRQGAFLLHGVQHLKPLNLKDVAQAISMHESTISRATANKYMATPRGVIELKYFFTSAIAATAEGGESHSSESVRHRIKALIENESPARVLSDDRIAGLLQTEGIDIARRTVAKYREAMRISSSAGRRRKKKHLEY